MVKKLLPWLILTIFVVFIDIVLLNAISQFAKSTEYKTPLVLLSKAEKEKTIKMVFVGDIMLDRGVEYMIEKEGRGDFRFPFLKIGDELKKADILFGNLEGTISDKGRKVGSVNSFRANPKAIKGLVFAGFDVLSVANNHTLDYTFEALKDTLLRLKEAGVDPVGAGENEDEAYSPTVKEVNGKAGSQPTKIAFLAYTNLGPAVWAAKMDNPGLAWLDWQNIERIKKDIQEAKNRSDIVVVSLHAGEEYTQKLSKFQTEFSNRAIEAGADLVIGHHPHVVQPNEKYRDGYIFYSLGNFIFDQDFSKETMKGQIVEVLIEGKKIKEVIPIEIKINNYFQPETLE